MEVKAPATPLDVVSLLEICHNIEVSCAEIYRRYADCFPDDEVLRQLWLKTSREEENHAKQFVLAINLRREGAIAAVNIEMIRAAQVLEMVKGISESIPVSPPAAIDALCTAIKLEEKLSGFHVDAIASFRDESIKKLFHAMMLADNQHLKALETMYQERLISGANA